MPSRRRYELVRWVWCSVHLGIAPKGTSEACVFAWDSNLPCSLWPLYAAKGTAQDDGLGGAE